MVLDPKRDDQEIPVEAPRGVGAWFKDIFANPGRWLPTAIAFASIYGLLIAFFHPDLILSTTTTSGGDTGAHHYPAQYLMEELLPNWKLTGWAPGWYAGMPMLTFYFPFPFLLIAILSFVFPYEVAFKIGTISGVFLLPLSVYALGRLWRIRKPFPVVGAALAAAFLLMERVSDSTYYSIYGGNILSTLAGEFGYMLSFALVFLFLGTVYRGMRKPKLNMLFVANCVLLLALTLSHIVTTIVLVALAPGLILPFVFSKGVGGSRKGLVRAGYAVAVVAYAYSIGALLHLPLWALCLGVAVLFIGLGSAFLWPVLEERSNKYRAKVLGFVVVIELLGACLVGFSEYSYVPLLSLVMGALVLVGGLGATYLWPVFARRACAARSALTYLVGVGLIGFCLSAFWSIPFAVNLKWTAHMEWGQLAILGKGVGLGLKIALAAVGGVGAAAAAGLGVYARRTGRRVMPMVVIPVLTTAFILIVMMMDRLSEYLIPRNWFIGVLGFGLLGMLYAVAKREKRLLPLAWVTVMAFLLYALMPDGRLWNARMLSFWYFSLYLWAAYGVACLIRLMVVAVWSFGRVFGGVKEHRRLRIRTRAAWWILVPVVALAVAAMAGGTSKVAMGWIKWNYTGYEKKVRWNQYEDILDYIETLPRHSRVMIEHGNDIIDQMGTPRAFEIIPYWTPADTMEGTLMEASFTASFHFINQRELSEKPSNAIIGVDYPLDIDVTRGITHLQLMNIPYFLAFDLGDGSERVIPAVEMDPRAELLATFNEFKLYHIKECSGYVEVMQNEPVRVSVPQDEWRDMAVDWYKSADALDTPLVWDNGEEALERFLSIAPELATNPPSIPIEGSKNVYNVDFQNEKLSFDTDAVGEPHWIKISYFPNWHVKGAEGPYLASPSMMMVIPTETHVELYYGRTWANSVGQGLEVGAWLVLIVLSVWRFVSWLRGRDEPEFTPDESTALAPPGPVTLSSLEPPRLPLPGGKKDKRDKKDRSP